MITTTRVPITSRITIAAVIEAKHLLQPDHNQAVLPQSAQRIGRTLAALLQPRVQRQR
jgi:hypothetical protein